MTRASKLAALVASAIAITAAPSAHALQDSTRGPFYAQAVVGGVSAWVDFPTAYYRVDAEFGVHFSGRADGFVLGVRQAFDVGRFSIGETVLRFGYDIAIPIDNGRYELSLAPYGTFGLNYIFQGLSTGLHWSVGFEGKFFVWRGLYGLLRPIELGIGQYFPGEFNGHNVFFNVNFGIGAGYAF